MLKLFNRILSTHSLPTSFTHAIVLPLHKVGKDPTIPSSYRPISLTNTIGKFLERIITNRLIWILEKHNLLSPYQSGFRSNRSTLDNIIKLYDTIIKGFCCNESTLGVFIDFEKAFDMVWKDGLIIKLQKIGISGNILDYIKNFLTNRTFQVKIANSLSDVHHLQNGTPQGSIISPLLFLVMINDFPNNPATNLSLFADDSAIYKASTNLKFLEKSLQKHLSEIENWCNRWGFKISTSKTTVVLFTKQKALQKIDLSIHGQKMKLSSSVKFLGIIFDKTSLGKNTFNIFLKEHPKD
jgi:hypothetical protein